MFQRLSCLSLCALLAIFSACGAFAQELRTSGSNSDASPAAPAPLATPSDTAASPFTSPEQRRPGLAPTASVPTLSAPISGPTGLLPDRTNSTKFYTFTVSLREEYDDNIYTTKDNKVGSPVTEFSPSLLVSFPAADSSFSARFTFGLDYYENRKNDPDDYTGEILLHYNHRFTDRFTLDMRDQGGYFTDPDLLNAVGTPFRSGAYFTNTLTADFDAQWTPLFGTATSYSNISILYDDSEIARDQNYDENTFSHDFRFAVYPKYNLTAGVVLDDLEYLQASRGYTTYTLDVGADWQALPTVIVSVRGGGSLTESDEVGSSVSPYGSATLNWILGKRSSLNFNYVHSVAPTDVFNAVGQETDRFSVQFSYDITPRINANLAATITHSAYTAQLLESGSSFTEDDAGLSAQLSYRINSNFSIEGGYSLSDVSSQEDERDYTRNQVYLGIRGTY